MGQSQVLEWLNENAYRAYPLRLTPGKEVQVKGLGRVTFGAMSSTVPNAYALYGAGSQFLSQLSPGDLIDVKGYRAEVLDVPAPTNTTVYLSQDLKPALQSPNYEYLIVKKNSALDSFSNVRDLTLDSIILDANIVYLTEPSSTGDTGRLVSIFPSGSSLIFSVFEQPEFEVHDYLTASYPYYVRNTSGSLLVVGEAAKNIITPITFLNQLFEASTISILAGFWNGVSSLSFNGVGGLTGEVVFDEGYQVELFATQATNTLKISAGRAYGLPIGCERLYGDSVPADCNDIITRINSCGVRADFANINLVGGTHVAVYPDPERHRIYVGLRFDKTDICQPAPVRPVTQI